LGLETYAVEDGYLPTFRPTLQFHYLKNYNLKYMSYNIPYIRINLRAATFLSVLDWGTVS